MSDRGTSYNVELNWDDGTVFPISMAEFGDNKQGTVEVPDGDTKYPVKDQIRVMEPVAFSINVHRDQEEFDRCERFADENRPRSVFVIYRDGDGNANLQYEFKNCTLNKGNKNPFDRASKSPDTREYMLVPQDIVKIPR